MIDIPLPWLINALLLLARTAGLVTFVPLPGLRQFPALPKAVLALTLAVLLFPLARGTPDVGFLNEPSALLTLTGLIISEAVFGLAVGTAVALLLEVFGLAAQILGFQAGYSYVNMIDPTTQVDASILNVLFALLGSRLVEKTDVRCAARERQQQDSKG